MQLSINDAIRDCAPLRHSFNRLAEQTFSLSFEAWYQAGGWTDRYIPHTCVVDRRVVANVSVNLMDTVWQRQPRRYMQLGTVMTDPAYRNQGLARLLLTTVLEKWGGQCDGIYLYANDSVLDFYPKFGFETAKEYQPCMPVVAQPSARRKLDISQPDDCAFLRRYYETSNPFSALPMLNQFGLLQF